MILQLNNRVICIQTRGISVIRRRSNSFHQLSIYIFPEEMLEDLILTSFFLSKNVFRRKTFNCNYTRLKKRRIHI